MKNRIDKNEDDKKTGITAIKHTLDKMKNYKLHDPLIENIESDAPPKEKIIGFHKQINIIKRNKTKFLKFSLVLFVVAIILFVILLYSIKTVSLSNERVSIEKYKSIENILNNFALDASSVTIDKDNVMHINGTDINEIINNNIGKIDIGESAIDNHFLIWFGILFLGSILSFIYALVFLLDFIFIESSKPYEDMLISTEEEMELSELKDSSANPFVDKQFKQHQRELKRYYDLNLTQSKNMFFLGMIVIFLGAVIIFGTIMVFRDNINNFIPLIIGCVSGVLVDFVGAIFVNMYSQNLKLSIEYHNKLVYSNNLLLSNVVSSRIMDEIKRDETYSTVAIEIAKNKHSLENGKKEHSV